MSDSIASKNYHPCGKQEPPRRKEVSPVVESLVRKAQDLSEDEYFQLLKELVWKTKCSADKMKTIKNTLSGGKYSSLTFDREGRPLHPGQEAPARVHTPRDLNQERKTAMKRGGVGDFSGESKRGRVEEKAVYVGGKQSSVVPSAKTNLPSCSIPKHIPVAEPPTLMIYSDRILHGTQFALDCEKVSVGNLEHQIHEQPSGDISIVDLQGKLVFRCFIDIRRLNICSYVTNISGLTEAKLITGYPLEMVKQLILTLFSVPTGTPKKTVYGIGIERDMVSLGFQDNSMPWNIYDLGDYFKDNKKLTIGIKALANHFGLKQVQHGQHSSLEDAKVTAMALRKMIQLKAQGMVSFNCPVMNQERETSHGGKKKWEGPFDTCKCGIVKKVKNKNQPDLGMKRGEVGKNKKRKQKKAKGRGFSLKDLGLADEDSVSDEDFDDVYIGGGPSKPCTTANEEDW